ncbi:MAG: aspartate/glutamate racemase family protein [Clostridia bacterium]|nr:aspartate/glutamate racemase family protein [Clostridia bacterium]
MYSLNNLPIGVFDSGIGGLNVLYKLLKTFKNENFVYFGDNLNAPYGNKSKEELLLLCKNAVNELLRYKVKAVVIACNTASTNCLDLLKKEFPNLIIIGTFPTVINTKQTILFATVNTAKSSFIKSKFNRCKIAPLKNLAKNIEEYFLLDFPIDLSEVKKQSKIKYKNVILGCTHYIYFKKEFKSIFGCRVYDGVNGVAKRLKNELKDCANIAFNRTLYFIGSGASLNFLVFKRCFRVISGLKVVIIPKKIKKN